MQGIFDFIKVRAIAKWAIHERNETIQSVSDALVAVYRADKPITKSTVGQYLDGIAKHSPRKQPTSNPLWD